MKAIRFIPLATLFAAAWLGSDVKTADASVSTSATSCQPGVYGSSATDVKYWGSSVRNEGTSHRALVHCPIEAETDDTATFYISVEDKHSSSGFNCTAFSYSWSGYIEDTSPSVSTSNSYQGRTYITTSTDGLPGSVYHVVSCYIPPVSGYYASSLFGIFTQ